MSKSLIERNPFREKSALFRIYDALAHSQKPLSAEEIAKRSKVKFDTTQRMLSAMNNFYHNSGMRRVGASLERKDGLLTLKSVKPDTKALRPERGKSKTAKKRAKGSKKQTKTEHRKSHVQPNKPKSQVAPKPSAAQSEAKSPSLNEREKLVLSTLGEAPKPVDQIIEATKLKPEEVLATLLVLEVRRLAKQHPGKQYSKSEAK
jgi:predicted Rossmann fold nucleotide-binding protein DprA/Smf involved in DNA uptake